LKRVRANTIDKRLLTEDGLPRFDLKFYILNRMGEYAGVSLYRLDSSGKPNMYAVCTESGPATLPMEGLLEAEPRD
ncbi:MAG TPA: hypothetical protein VKD67_06290, partial [Acidimicrobiales bacterium]|nr:hypothetical protein [Acidimicrobiales bacterium]